MPKAHKLNEDMKYVFFCASYLNKEVVQYLKFSAISNFTNYLGNDG